MRFVSFALLLILPSSALAQGRAFTPADWHRVTTVSDPAVSPDGRRIAFTVTTVVEKENRRHSEIWLAPSDGSTPARRITVPTVESSNPRWSPDGTLLLFTSTRPGSSVRSWAMRMDGAGGEAFAYDSIPAGASLTRNRQVIVWGAPPPRDSTGRTRDTAFAKMPATARPPWGSVTRPVDPARFDGRHIVDLPYKSNNQGFMANPAQAPEYRAAQVWRRRGDTGAREQLTRTAYSHRNVTVSPDGQWIAFTADPELRPDSLVEAIRDSIAKLPYDAARDEAPRNDSDIFLLPAAGGEPRRLTRGDGSEGSLVWSPDGARLAFVARVARTAQAQLQVVEVRNGAVRDLLGDWQYEPGDVTWLRDGRLAVSAAIGGRTALHLVDPSGRRTETIAGRRRLSGFDFDTSGAVTAYVSTSMTQPTELYVARPDGTGERKLTTFNDALNSEIAWSDAERFTYPSVGGLEIEGWLMKPHGYQAGKRYPLVLYIHGGPHSAYGENWFDEFQNLAGAGMFVLFTNPRGSSGYGANFTFATRGRWFAEDYEDLMKAVDIAAARPDVDPERLGVTGGSYGGVMTAWVTVKTQRFAAAQTDRMISNWWSWYGSSDAQGLTEFEFYGKPWDNPAMYDSLSPIRFIRQVTTPTLMVQSEEDHRTPMTDAEQWFVGLKKQGTPVEWVRYPRSTHDLSRTGEPWLLVDRLGRLRQWFGHWLTPDETP